MLRSILRIAALFVSCTLPALAQGTGSYFNVESPQCKPITVARIAGHDYLLVCNTPDNSVEVYDTVGNAYVTRALVGAEPVSVVWNATLGRFYTTNFLGDSVTVARIDATTPITVTVERTVHVGDEPMHLAFSADNLTAYVSLGSQSAITLRGPLQLTPIVQSLPLLDTYAAPASKAIKDPRTVGRFGNFLFVLGTRGSVTGLWRLDLATGVVALAPPATNPFGLGTTNFNMTFAANGDLYVVGARARVDSLSGESNVRSAPLGFVESFLYRIPSAGAGTLPAVQAHSLNLIGTVPAPASMSLAHPTDVEVYQPNPSNPVQKVYVAAFNSDRVGVINVSAANPPFTVTARIDIPVAANPISAMAGPRGLAMKYATGQQGDPGDRVYVLNRLDNSVAVIDPATDTWLTTFRLQFDPTPTHIKLGRPFLYSAKLSGNGKVACASCHIDGRSDWLAWDLSDGVAASFPAGIHPFRDGEPISRFNTFPANKGQMVTQSLQGLATYETNSQAQRFFATEPLHWRGDREFFRDFNGAFVNLMGMPDLNPGGPPKGISDAAMEQYRAFVFAIAYPPNPEQPDGRAYSGNLGDPNNALGANPGSLAQRGMKLFHIQPLGVCSGRSCVQCHALPSGSNSRYTVSTGNIPPNSPQPIESAALRQTRQKEIRLVLDANTFGSNITTGFFGLLHEGVDFTPQAAAHNSINDFINITFGGQFTGGQDVIDVVQFVREFDTGVAPLVGRALTVDITNRTSSDVTNFLNLAEGQVNLANVGLAVQAVLSTGLRGFWLDITNAGSPLYRDDAAGQSLPRANLLALLSTSADRLIFQATPLGSDRRFARVAVGPPIPLTGQNPTGGLAPMMPNVAWRDVPLMKANWNNLVWTGGTEPTPASLQKLRIFQDGMRQDGQGQFGSFVLRHEPPRRFQVAGLNIRHGAKLVMYVNAAPGNPGPLIPFVLPLYPTDQITINGEQIWQTAVEADPLTTYVLLVGGENAQGVANVLNPPVQPLPEPPTVGTFNPVAWNKVDVWILNEDATWAHPGLQPLKLP